MSISGNETKKSFSPVALGTLLLMLRDGEALTRLLPLLTRHRAAAATLACSIPFRKLPPSKIAMEGQFAHPASASACCRRTAAATITGRGALVLAADAAGMDSTGPAMRMLANIRDMLPAADPTPITLLATDCCQFAMTICSVFTLRINP